MKTEEIKNLIRELVEKISGTTPGLSDSQEDNTTWVSLEVADPFPFSQKGGEGLYALNHLVRRIIETKNPDFQDEIVIDVNNFQKKRIENIRAVAHMMAERARYFKSNIEVDPMPAFERRIVHEFLSEATDLKTESEGFGPSRRVVIKYIGELN